MKRRWIILPILSFAICAAIIYTQWPRKGVAKFKDNFGKGINPAWSPKTPEKWQLTKEGRKSLYQLNEPGNYSPGIVRPSEYSLISHLAYTDFTFKCKLRCDAPVDQRYRDVVIIFGYQDDTHFYYAHFSNISDDLHNGIMLINGDSRRRLNKDIPEPALTDMNFHKVKLERKSDDIKVYFDGKLLMEAQDSTFTSGKVGIGSMDDTGSFDNVYIKGKVPARMSGGD